VTATEWDQRRSRLLSVEKVLAVAFHLDAVAFDVSRRWLSADQPLKGSDRVTLFNDPLDPLLDPVSLLLRQLRSVFDDLQAELLGGHRLHPADRLDAEV